MDVQLDQLRAFVAVVDDGTFEAAARRLRVTPSAISQRIKALESAVGRVLMQRVKPVRPTESGEAILRLARQITLLEDEAVRALGAGSGEIVDGSHTAIPLVVNSDSLATWALPALARVSQSHRVTFDVFREDQDHSTARLRDGSVMAAITSVAEPVQGCIVRRLGRMRYRAMATPEFIARWFPSGLSREPLRAAPVVVYDRTDDLQDRYLRRHAGIHADPPRHFVPASSEFASAVRLGMGWGMVPDAQIGDDESTGVLTSIGDDPIEVPLYWQQWRLQSDLLAVVADEIVAAAGAALG
jgi:LysR family transcriptional regulator (chromosome initiation inhibitor)